VILDSQDMCVMIKSLRSTVYGHFVFWFSMDLKSVNAISNFVVIRKRGGD